jgi:hypothetical protein
MLLISTLLSSPMSLQKNHGSWPTLQQDGRFQIVDAELIQIVGRTRRTGMTLRTLTALTSEAVQ